jgi:thiol-disulfide isomerase/thioredoxin
MGRALWRFCHPFYVLNGLACFSYALVALLVGIGENADGEPTRSDQIFLTLLMWLFVKFLRAPTTDAFLAQIFFFTKAAILVSAYLVGTRLFVGYLVLFAVLFVLLQQPQYEGVDRVQFLDGSSFNQHVLSSSGNRNRWLVYMYATWCSPCITLSPLISDLSLE